MLLEQVCTLLIDMEAVTLPLLSQRVRALRLRVCHEIEEMRR
jgi:hypothetical protein